MQDQTITYIFIIVTSILLIFLVVVTTLYLRIVRKYLDIREGRSEEVDPNDIIREAQEKAQRILDKAQVDSREIIAKAKRYLDLNQNLVARELKEATKIYAKKYEQILLMTQDHILKMIQNIPEDTKKTLMSQISVIHANLEKEVRQASEEAKSLVVEAYKKAEQEVEDYRNRRMEQIDDVVVATLKEIARKVLLKEINQEEHEKLVIKALEEAKRQGVFGSQKDEKNPDN